MLRRGRLVVLILLLVAVAHSNAGMNDDPFSNDLAKGRKRKRVKPRSRKQQPPQPQPSPSPTKPVSTVTPNPSSVPAPSPSPTNRNLPPAPPRGGRGGAQMKAGQARAETEADGVKKAEENSSRKGLSLIPVDIFLAFLAVAAVWLYNREWGILTGTDVIAQTNEENKARYAASVASTRQLQARAAAAAASEYEDAGKCEPKTTTTPSSSPSSMLDECATEFATVANLLAVLADSTSGSGGGAGDDDGSTERREWVETLKDSHDWLACQIVLLQESASGDVSSSVAKTVRFEDQALQDRLEAEKSREGKLQRDLQTFKSLASNPQSQAKALALAENSGLMHLKDVEEFALKVLGETHPAATAAAAAREGRMLTGSGSSGSSGSGSGGDGGGSGGTIPSSDGAVQREMRQQGATTSMASKGDLVATAQQIQLFLQQLDHGNGNAASGTTMHDSAVASSERIASMQMSLDVFLKQADVDMHEDKKKQVYELARKEQAAKTARHLQEDADRKAEFADKMRAKRAALEHSMKTAATRAAAKRSKEFENARKSMHVSTHDRMVLQLMVAAAVVMIVAVAHVWSQLTAEGDVCAPPGDSNAPENSKGIWGVVSWMPGVVSTPLLNAKHTLCTTQQDIKTYTRWLVAIVVVVAHSILSYLGGSVSGFLFLLIVGCGCTHKYFASLFWRGPKAAAVLLAAPVLVVCLRWAVRAWDDKRSDAPATAAAAAGVGGNRGSGVSSGVSSLPPQPSPERAFEWKMRRNGSNLRPIISDSLTLGVGLLAAGSAHWLFCEHAECWTLIV